LKSGFKDEGLILAAALSGYVEKVSNSAYEVDQLGDVLDFASVMTYDYHGFWDKVTGHHAPIQAQQEDLNKDFNLVRFDFFFLISQKLLANSHGPIHNPTG